MKKLEISKEDLKYNLNQINNLIEEECKKHDKPKPEIIAVAKSNGMGLDLIKYSKFLSENGVKKIAVSNVDEAVILEKENIDAEIIMLSPTSVEEEVQALIESGATITIGSEQDLEIAKKVCDEKSKVIKACLKIDTGFSRYGFIYKDIDNIISTLKNEKNLEFVYCFSHLSDARSEVSSYKQFNRFLSVKKKIEECGIKTLKYHICNSTGFLKYNEMWMDCVRLGSCIQGRALVKKELFKVVGSFKSNVAAIKYIDSGETVSYSNIFKAPKRMKIAVIPVGNMDGFNYGKLRDDYTFKNNVIAVLMEFRKIFRDNTLKVKINGKKRIVIGRLGMYHCIVDVTDDPNVEINQEVQIDIAPLNVNSNIRREYI
ncbi:MAG: alanine racemase [Clostridia bacterium]|nr:alanine racemase [Clostridia bacterium]